MELGRKGKTLKVLAFSSVRSRLWWKLKTLRRGRELLFLLERKLGIPRRPARRITKIAKCIIFWKEELKRKTLASGYNVRTMDRKIAMDISNQGFAKTNLSRLSMCSELLSACETVVEQWRALDSASRASLAEMDAKQFRPNILEKRDLLTTPIFLRFATSQDILNPVICYLKTIPVLAEVTLWWTFKNDLLQQSQRFHLDQEDYKQVKVFVNIWRVDIENGPLTIVPLEASKAIYQSVRQPYGRIEDEQVFAKCPEAEILSLTGGKGEVAFVDTTRLYHMGSRARQGERLVLVFHYVPFTCIMEPNAVVLKGMSRELETTDSEIKNRLLLANSVHERIWREKARPFVSS